MSPPAEKARSPAPVTTMRVTPSSSAHASSCAASALTMPRVTALSAFGRLSVTSPAAPRREKRISSVLRSVTRRSVPLPPPPPPPRARGGGGGGGGGGGNGSAKIEGVRKVRRAPHPVLQSEAIAK